LTATIVEILNVVVNLLGVFITLWLLNVRLERLRAARMIGGKLLQERTIAAGRAITEAINTLIKFSCLFIMYLFLIFAVETVLPMVVNYVLLFVSVFSVICNVMHVYSGRKLDKVIGEHDTV